MPEPSEKKEIILVRTVVHGRPFLTSHRGPSTDHPGPIAYSFWHPTSFEGQMFGSFVQGIQKYESSFNLPFVALFPGLNYEIILDSIRHRWTGSYDGYHDLEGFKRKFVPYNNKIISIDEFLEICFEGKNEYLAKQGEINCVVDFMDDNPKTHKSEYSYAFSALQNKGYKVKEIVQDY